VLWDCVDTDRYHPGKPDAHILYKYGIPFQERNIVRVLTLGRLSSATNYKGYERLLNIFPQLPENAYLIYGGGGDLITTLREKAQGLGVVDRVIFTGFIDENDLPDIYRCADIFCLVGDRGPGRGEGIPLTPLEAAACGVPILVGNQDGSQEAVEHGINGYALDPFDQTALVNTLRELSENKHKRLEMGRAARNRVEREHAYPVFRQKLNEIVNRRLAGGEFKRI
jgi:phosphatidyl-myo-inositol dimannoside synthase